MKILWFTNLPLKEISNEIGIPAHKGGGWMDSLAKLLSNTNEVELSVLSFYSGVDYQEKKINQINYFLIPNSFLREPYKLNSLYAKLIDKYNFEVVHIHGTEYKHGLNFLKTFRHIKSIVSIQGLVEIYARYFYAGLKLRTLLVFSSLIEILKQNTFYHQKRSFIERGKSEREYFRYANIILGRTSWDYTHSKSINKNIQYITLNETLREEFYSGKNWNVNNKQDHVIFVSQASYPIKGFHILLNAVSMILDQFPKIRIRVAGENFVREETILDKLKITGYWYGKYIKYLIDQYKINVEFIGVCDSGEMVNEYLNAHVVICPSSIENSPNSIGEAQILGVPVIASFVGGIPDMIIHQKTGLLYRFEEVEMLAHYISQIFLNENLAMTLSKNEMLAAKARHDQDFIRRKILNVYKLDMPKK